MSARIIGSGGASFGLTAESFFYVQNFRYTVNSKKIEIPNSNGSTQAALWYDFRAEVEASGFGSAGNVSSLLIGSQQTFSNSPGSGNLEGSTYLESVEASLSPTGFNSISMRGVQYNLF